MEHTAQYRLHFHAAEYHLNMAEDAMKHAQYDLVDHHLNIAKDYISKRLEMEKS